MRSLSNLLGVAAVEVVKSCIRLGVEVKDTETVIPPDVADLVADEFGYRVECVLLAIIRAIALN